MVVRGCSAIPILMNIEGLVVQEAMVHIEQFGFVKNMDPMALHILKTSENPSVVAMRHWMRRAALQSFHEAQKEQKIMNEEFAREPYSKRSDIRRSAVVHPYYASKASQQGHAWSDKDFVGRIKRDNPKCFPKREGR